MKIVIDSREKNRLEFKVDGVEESIECLNVGDYSAYINGLLDSTVIERKEISDLFNSFTNNYDAERSKITRAKELGLKYILAIECSWSEIRKGHSYWKDGQVHESKKSGLAMVRQLLSISTKYGVEVHCFQSRSEMKFWILEYFLSKERLLNKKSD